MVSLVRLASGIVWIEEAQPTAGSTVPGQAGRQLGTKPGSSTLHGFFFKLLP